MKLFIVILLTLSFVVQSMGQSSVFEMKKGKVAFTSEAPLELISARSKSLAGVLDISRKQFAFKVFINTFDGFNNAMQKEHFNENYLESNIYPAATFQGKIIEDIDLSKKGTITLRSKGKFSVHGVEQERIIEVKLNIISPEKIEVSSRFKVLLADHNIKIPKVVTEKLSPEIWADIEGQLLPKK